MSLCIVGTGIVFDKVYRVLLGGRQDAAGKVTDSFYGIMGGNLLVCAILSLPLIQKGQLSFSGGRMCTILVNRLED